jgi:hypothetical protein
MAKDDDLRKCLDLLVVHWASGEHDVGVVSLKQGRWLMYAWGRLDGISLNIPEIGIEDQDFDKLMGNEEPNWDDVVPLLKLPNFPLLKRINEARILNAKRKKKG